MTSIRDISPLRYPGGKAKLTDFFKKIIASNELVERSYAEPYAGGCGLGLNLLLSGHVSRLYINDFDRSIWAFWHSILYNTEAFCGLIEGARVDVENWRRQRDLQSDKESLDPLTLGFSTFFLNRTNRSGIIHSGGCIGGADQQGNYKIDCRFNRAGLQDKIRRIAKYKNRIHLSYMDAEQFVVEIGSESRSILYIDPPYYEKGQALYKNSYRPHDHKRLAELFLSLKNPFVITYDDVDGIRSLYKDWGYSALELQYSAQVKRRARELLIAGNLRLPNETCATIL